MTFIALATSALVAPSRLTSRRSVIGSQVASCKSFRPDSSSKQLAEAGLEASRAKDTAIKINRISRTPVALGGHKNPEATLQTGTSNRLDVLGRNFHRG